MAVITLAVTAICIALCVASVPADFTAADRTPVAETVGGQALQYTDNFLIAIKERPGKKNPPNMRGVPYFPECWDTLQGIMAANANEYDLAVIQEFDSSTPANGLYLPHDFTDATVNVTFPDGTVIELYYYNGFLQFCRRVAPQDGTPPAATLTQLPKGTP